MISPSVIPEHFFVWLKSLPDKKWRQFRGIWVAQSVERLTFDFGSGRDLTVWSLLGNLRLPVSLPLPASALSLSLSLSLSPNK